MADYLTRLDAGSLSYVEAKTANGGGLLASGRVENDIVLRTEVELFNIPFDAEPGHILRVTANFGLYEAAYPPGLPLLGPITAALTVGDVGFKISSSIVNTSFLVQTIGAQEVAFWALPQYIFMHNHERNVLRLNVTGAGTICGYRGKAPEMATICTVEDLGA